ncbi:hypothetical protein AHAS_Ahas09G0138000 [Arachis hypogaea]
MTIKGAWHARSRVWHANTLLEEPLLWRATLCRRRGTPAPEFTLACHLRTKAWHAKLIRPTIEWACHLSNKAWHASEQGYNAKAGRATWYRWRGTPAQEVPLRRDT